MQRKDVFVSGIAKIKQCSHEGCTKVVARVTEELAEDRCKDNVRNEAVCTNIFKRKKLQLRRDVPATIKRKTCIYEG